MLLRVRVELPDRPGALGLGLLVEDGWKRQGIGTALLPRVAGFATTVGQLLLHHHADNRGVRRILDRLGAARRTAVTAGVATTTVALRDSRDGDAGPADIVPAGRIT